MLLSWILVTYGVTLVLTGSKITAPLRRLFVSLTPTRFRGGVCFFVQCPMCVGLWVGLGLALLEPRLGPLATLGLPRWEQGLGEAFAASGVCWAIHVVLARLGAEEL
jgi:hypothetical protein